MFLEACPGTRSEEWQVLAARQRAGRCSPQQVAAVAAAAGGLLELHATSDNKIAPARASLLVVYISHPSLTLKLGAIVDCCAHDSKRRNR